MSDGDKVRILYIEDRAEMIDLVRIILGEEFIVDGAESGEEGLEMMHENRPDLLLLDLGLSEGRRPFTPGERIDGWEVYRRMKADAVLRDVPVIIVTAMAVQPIDVVLGRHVAKVEDYITKPFSPRELVQRVKRVLGDREGHTSAP